MAIRNYVAQSLQMFGINAWTNSEELIPELEAKSTQRVIPFLKKFEQQLSAVLKTVLEVGVQRFTSLFGTKK